MLYSGTENGSASRGVKGPPKGGRMEMKSVLRSLRVLEAVAQHQPVTVGELTKVFGLPKSTLSAPS